MNLIFRFITYERVISHKPDTQSKKILKSNDEFLNLIKMYEMQSKSEYPRQKMSKFLELRLRLTCLILSKHIMLDGFKYLYSSKDLLTKYRWIIYWRIKHQIIKWVHSKTEL